jgi:uncharacterized protein YecT (DUF1311 family)
MKKFIVVMSVFILPFLPVEVVAENCTGSTGEMFRCAQRMFEKADAKLNQVWQQLPQGTRDNLRQAQLNWINYKEQKCRNEADMGRNGTTQPLIELGCLTGETEKRTAELEKF